MNRSVDSDQFNEAHVALLCSSFHHWTGRALLPDGLTGREAANLLFEAPFAVVSHNIDNDPLFNYANRRAMELFEMSREEIIGLPSRISAEPVNREERARLLKAVSTHGYIDDYSGVRISSSGRRFRISGATVWNLVDEDGNPAGQAAMFSNWEFLE